MPPAFASKLRTARPTPYRAPEGQCIYAIGDVHGCLDALNLLLEAISKDARDRSLCAHLIFLGDLVDRGPHSAQVIDRLLSGDLPADVHDVLMGNHEEIMLACHDGRSDLYLSWLQYGGVETLESYGLERQAILDAPSRLSELMQKAIPQSHVRFLRSLRDWVRHGDYLFVHAGIRPRIPLEEQSSQDLRWIRHGFLDDPEDHGCIVVHGHTIVSQVEFHENRIAVDTGCYFSGQLSAVALETNSARSITVTI